MPSKPVAKWSDVKRKLTDLDKAGLIGLVQDLFNVSASNKAFLAARFLSDEDGGAALEGYRDRIYKCFFKNSDRPIIPKLSEARSIIREYQKARGDAGGVLELMLTYVESGTEYTSSYGDIDSPFI